MYFVGNYLYFFLLWDEDRNRSKWTTWIVWWIYILEWLSVTSGNKEYKLCYSSHNKLKFRRVETRFTWSENRTSKNYVPIFPFVIWSDAQLWHSRVYCFKVLSMSYLIKHLRLLVAIRLSPPFDENNFAGGNSSLYTVQHFNNINCTLLLQWTNLRKGK